MIADRLIDGAMARGLLRLVGSAGLIGGVSVLVLLPFLMVLGASFLADFPPAPSKSLEWTLANYAAIWSGVQREALMNTLVIACGGTAMAVVIGALLAWLAARTDIPFKPLVHLAGITPLFMSLVVAAVTWSFIGSGRTGYLNIIFDSLGLPFRLELRSLGGITFISGLYYVPYAYIFLYSALGLLHPDLEEAAATHGGDLRRTLSKVTFPLVKPALIGAVLLVFVSLIEDFPVPSILGGPVGIYTLSTRIYFLMTAVPAHPSQAGAISVILTAIVCLLVYTQRRILRGRDFRTVTGKGMQRRLVPLGWLKPVAVAVVLLYAFVAVGLPILGLLVGALRTSLYVPNAAALFDVSEMSLRHLVAAASNPSVQQGLFNSVIVCAATAFIGGGLYFLIAFIVHRTTLPGRQILDYMVMVPLALPALVMALGILWTWLIIPVPVYGTLAILVIAFITRFMPQGYRTISGSVLQIHNELEEAAMVAGAGRWRAAWRITLPLIRGAVVSSAFLIVVLGMRELTASLFLYTTRTRVLSIVIYEAYGNGIWTQVASISLLFTALLALFTIAGRRWMRAAL